MATDVLQYDPLLTTREMAKLLGVAPGTLEVWRTTKRYPLPYVKVGRKVLYRRSAGEAVLTSRTVGAYCARRKRQRPRRSVRIGKRARGKRRNDRPVSLRD